MKRAFGRPCAPEFYAFAYRQGRGENAIEQTITVTGSPPGGACWQGVPRIVDRCGQGSHGTARDARRGRGASSTRRRWGFLAIQPRVTARTRSTSPGRAYGRWCAWSPGTTAISGCSSYPDGQTYVGRPVAELIQHNAERGLLSDERRCGRRWVSGTLTRHRQLFFWPGELIGNPMPGGSVAGLPTYRVPQRRRCGILNEGLEQRVSEHS
jgi:hypothetical protein